MLMEIATALSYLYSPASLEAIHPHNARSVLAAACLLGGMDELANYTYQLALSSVSVETVMEWLDFLDSLPADTESHGTVFGPYARQMREDIFQFLVVSLPLSLEAFTSGESPASPVAGAVKPAGAEASGQEALLQVYARLPFDLFKRAMESQQFPLCASRSRTFIVIVTSHATHSRAARRFASSPLQIRKTRNRAAQDSWNCQGLRGGDCGSCFRHWRRERHAGSRHTAYQEACLLQGRPVRLCRVSIPFAAASRRLCKPYCRDTSPYQSMLFVWTSAFCLGPKFPLFAGRFISLDLRSARVARTWRESISRCRQASPVLAIRDRMAVAVRRISRPSQCQGQDEVLRSSVA